MTAKPKQSSKTENDPEQASFFSGCPRMSLSPPHCFGFPNKMKQTLKRLIKFFIFRRYTLVLLERDLALPVRCYKESKRWHIRLLTEDDLPRCQTHFSHQGAYYKEQLQKGNTCFIALNNQTGDVIGVVWHTPEDYADSFNHFTFKVAPHQVFQFAGEVAAPFRNTQVSAEALAIAWQYHRDKGKTHAITAVDSTNTASLRILFHLGMEETGEQIHFYRWLGIRAARKSAYQGERFAHLKKKHKHR